MCFVLKAFNWFWKSLLRLDIFSFLFPIFLLLKYVNYSFLELLTLLCFIRFSFIELVHVFLSPIMPLSVNIGQSSFSILVRNGRNFQQNWSELRAKLVENRRKWSDFGGSHLRRGLKVLVWFYHIQKVSSVYEVYTQKIASLYPRFVTYHDFRTYWLF